MDAWKLRILHISDLQEGHTRAGSWRARRALGPAWTRNLEAVLEEGPIDLVCFTGDAAYRGDTAEFAQASSFFEELLTKLSLPRERLFLVPGNHDVDRSRAVIGWQTLRHLSTQVDASTFSQWLAGASPPAGVEAGLREQVLSRMAAYRAWLGELGRKELFPESSPHRYLGYRRTLRLPGQPFDIHVAGLDTAWLSGDDADAGRLLLTAGQLEWLASERGKPLTGFRLALLHHPLSHLADAPVSEAFLAEKVDLLLRGHLHEEALETWEDSTHAARQLAAGGLHGAEGGGMGCTVVEAELDQHGRPLRYVMRFRAWSPRGYWYDSEGLHPEAKGGRLTWWMAARADALPGVFVGREAELDTLAKTVLGGGRGPWGTAVIHGMAGVGKTALAERLAALYPGSLPGGCVRVELDASTPEGPEALLRVLAERLGLSAEGRRLDQVRQRLQRPRALLLLDGVDSAQAADAARQLAARLDGCPIIIAGRFRAEGGDRRWPLLEVQPLDETAALQLLAREFRPARDGREREEHRNLVHELGHLPLAIQMVGTSLRSGAERELSKVSSMSRASLRAIFEGSLQGLRVELAGKAEQLMRGLASLGHAPTAGFGLSLGAAIAGLLEADFLRLVHAAERLSIVQRELGGQRKDDAWRLHPLWAEFLRQRPGGTEGPSRMAEWFLSRLPERPVTGGQKQGQRWDELNQEGAALAEWLGQVAPEDMERVEQAGSWYAMLNGPFHAWMAFCERALAHLHKPAARSNVLWTLAQVALTAGALERAFEAAREKADIDRKRGAEREAALAAGVSAGVLQARGEYEEALRILKEESLPVYERLGDVRERAVTQQWIADILQARGEYEEALRILKEEALPVFERLGAVRQRAIALRKVANILLSRGEHAEARRILTEEVLPVVERLKLKPEKEAVQELFAQIERARENPFRPGKALTEVDTLPGRERVLRELLTLIEQRSPTVLRGPRRAGKTSLLHTLKHRLGQDWTVRHETLEGATLRSADDLACVLEPKLRGTERPAEILRERLRAERAPVLLLDEVAHLQNADPTVFMWLRALGQERTAMIFVGSHGDWRHVTRQAARAPGSSFGNDVTPVDLGPLSEQAALSFLRDTAPEDVPFSDQLARWIMGCCGTWPFYLQVMGYALVQAAREGERAPFQAEQALLELRDRSLLMGRSPVFEGRWGELPARVKELLEEPEVGQPAMAQETLVGRSGPAP